MGHSVDSRVYRSEALEEGEGQKYRFSKNRKAEWRSEESTGQLESERDDTWWLVPRRALQEEVSG